MRNRIALLGSALIGAALLCGAAGAQGYDTYDSPRYADAAPSAYDTPYEAPRTYGYAAPSGYDTRPAPSVETVIVRPDYEYIEKRNLVGNINGEHNPTAFSISRPVEFSDLDLANAADRRELRDRVRDTAEDLCFQLDARIPQLSGDRSADQECIRNATRNAMRDVYDRRG